MQAYKLLQDSKIDPEMKAGTVVYRQAEYDYGCASDDTRTTGVEHISVTRNRKGGYPGFTIPLSHLKACEPPPLNDDEKLTEEHVANVCRPGAGAETCRYLTAGAKGFECAKDTGLAFTLDERVKRGEMTACGDNCPGRFTE